MALVACCITS
uniref:Uncharacterized protein n=1 Tax=Anguilla anguilla TaxID=7936 RepID=A0A0E9TE01_ANGAN